MRNILSFIKKHWLVIAAFIVSIAMFYPSLSAFFTHDDFYFLKISKVGSLSEFANFFNLAKDVDGIGVYRPLTLRAYYYLGSTVFNLNPLSMQIISFITFLIDIFLVGYLAKLLTKNEKIAALTLFLYATSVTHFGQLYYIGAFQELFITFTFLSSIIFFAKYELQKSKVRNLVFSFSFFLFGLVSKETAAMIPPTLILVHYYLKFVNKVKISFRSLVVSLTPYIFVTIIYLLLHFFSFGLIAGDSYIWDFSFTRALNTTGWYILWSLNIPEMFVDFIGPGVHFNPNLMKYWSADVIPIFALFILQTVLVCYVVIKSKVFNHKQSLAKSEFGKYIILFSVLWFVLTLLPVAFLPLHKFTYYLTLPLFGVVFLLSYLFINLKSKIYILFCLVWLTLSAYSLRLTIKTNWITQGVETSERVHIYFKDNHTALNSKEISFIDVPEDEDLPWSPTATLKIVLSEYNFFEVFYPELQKYISYGNEKAEILIRSRDLLGY